MRIISLSCFSNSRFRPNDVFCKPTCGERSKESSFLLRVKKMKRKNPKPGQEAERKIETELAGVVDATYKFGNLCDFQYLPAVRKGKKEEGKKEDGSEYEPIYDQVRLQGLWSYGQLKSRISLITV